MSASDSDSAPAWVERVCRVAAEYYGPGNDYSVHALFEAAAPDLGDEAAFLDLVTPVLRDHPDLIDSWRAYSDNKRTDRGPYITEGNMVGFYDGGDHRTEDVARHTDAAAACADFLLREALLVLERRRRGATP